MCGGIDYQGEKVYFPNPQARLLVRLCSGNVTWVTWGNRKKDANRNFPNGGWARLDSIYAGKWKPWHPKPVLIAADQFMEKLKATITLDTFESTHYNSSVTH